MAELRDGGTRLVIADVDDDVRAELDRYGITAAIGTDGLLATAAEVVEAYLASEGAASGGTGGGTTEPAT